MRNICIVTGSRAEYGLLRWVMQGIQDTPDLTLQVVATGMHLSPEFGMTIQEIGADGFKPDETVEILLSSDTPTAICKGWVEKYLGNGNNIRFESPQRLIKQIAWPDPGLRGNAFIRFLKGGRTGDC